MSLGTSVMCSCYQWWCELVKCFIAVILLSTKASSDTYFGCLFGDTLRAIFACTNYNRSMIRYNNCVYTTIRSLYSCTAAAQSRWFELHFCNLLPTGLLRKFVETCGIPAMPYTMLRGQRQIMPLGTSVMCSCYQWWCELVKCFIAVILLSTKASSDTYFGCLFGDTLRAIFACTNYNRSMIRYNNCVYTTIRSLYSCTAAAQSRWFELHFCNLLPTGLLRKFVETCGIPAMPYTMLRGQRQIMPLGTAK